MAKRTTTIGTRLDAALLALQLQAQGPAVDPTKDQVDTGKSTSQAPPDYGSEHAAWLDRAERLVEGIADVVRGAQPKTRKTAPELRAVIGTYEGRPAIYVAYHEGCSVELVYKVRAARGQDELGFRRPAPLTAREVPEDTGPIPSCIDDNLLSRSETTPSGEDES
jgi:hypothetical protein